MTTEARRVDVTVRREHRRWTAEAPDIGMWTSGRTLTDVTDRATAAAALALDTSPERIDVQLMVDSPEVKALAQARWKYDAALAGAVAQLRADGVPWSEVATIVQVPQRTARQAVSE